MCSTSMCAIQVNKVCLKLTTYYTLIAPLKCKVGVRPTWSCQLRIWLGEDIYKLIFRGDREQLESIMDKMITDSLSVSNSSNRNGNSWFVALIASFNIMAKTFAKMFVGLSATIVAIKWRFVLTLHFEAKYAKMNYKIKSTRKNG